MRTTSKSLWRELMWDVICELLSNRNGVVSEGHDNMRLKWIMAKKPSTWMHDYVYM